MSWRTPIAMAAGFTVCTLTEPDAPNCPPIDCPVERCTNEERQNMADAECEKYSGPNYEAIVYCMKGEP